jgi:serine/threonine protein kinase
MAAVHLASIIHHEKPRARPAQRRAEVVHRARIGLPELAPALMVDVQIVLRDPELVGQGCALVLCSLHEMRNPKLAPRSMSSAKKPPAAASSTSAPGTSFSKPGARSARGVPSKARRLRTAQPQMTEQRRRKLPPLPPRRSERPPLPVRRSERPVAAAQAPPEEPERVVRPTAAVLSTIGSSELWSKKIRVIEEIDRGGMSYIARGTDLTLHRELALKVSPLPRKQMPRAQLARFIEEAQITAQLEHPNVVPVHELGLDPEGRAYFSMKRVHGQSLEAILERRRGRDPKTLSEFGLRRLLDVFLQICQAIEYAHARGVVHRDLKPTNIMVGDFGEVLVMDWGVAKLIHRPDPASPTVSVEELPDGVEEVRASQPPGEGSSSLSSKISDVTSLRSGKEALATQAGLLIGTPAYMSPEQARGESVDERSDLYALGVILYEILCGALPIDDDDPRRLLVRVLNEAPRRPSEVNPATPLALETLALRLLEKEPDRRALPLSQVRSHIQDHIEGIGRDYRRPSLWANVLWMAGALSLFAFLVWYLTGQSISALFVLAPATVFNAVGWFLLILALGYPLWTAYLALRPGSNRDRFGAPSADEQLASGYFAHRTFATALAPAFQLVFVGEIASLAIARARRGDVQSAEQLQRITAELRAEWAQSLIVILIFLFAYLFFLSSEVRFARQIDRYDALVARPRWEAVWPFSLIMLLLLTIGTTHVLEWALSGQGNVGEFVRRQVLAQQLDLVEIGKTLVFQGTFLAALVLAIVLLAFPPAEVLAAMRLPYQPADEAAVEHRTQYLVRSVAVFRVARVAWLYGGAVIGGLTAMTILSNPVAEPLVSQVLYILGPSLIGFVGYSATRRYLRKCLRHAPAVERLLQRQVESHRLQTARIVCERLERVAWRHRIFQIAVPFACIALYLLWTGSGIHQRAIQQLVMPVTTKGWLLILPYALLVPVALLRDSVQRIVLRRRLRRARLAVAPASIDADMST